MGPANPEHYRPAEASDSFDERALVARARTDPSGFGVLYRAYVDRIYAFAWSRDRTQLFMIRGNITSDVILISNFR